MLFLLAAALFGMLFLLTIFMQALAGYSVLRTGLALLPIAIAELIACAVGPRLMARFGLRAAGFAAAAAAAIGLAWLARSTPASGYAPGLLVPMALAALGCGIILLPVSLPRPERGAEPAILPFTSRQIGLTLGSAAVISAVSASFRGRVPSSGPGSRDVLDNAFLDAIHVGFATAALLAATAAIIALAIPRRAVPPD
jgi:hypothetical protein